MTKDRNTATETHLDTVGKVPTGKHIVLKTESLKNPDLYYNINYCNKRVQHGTQQEQEIKYGENTEKAALDSNLSLEHNTIKVNRVGGIKEGTL
jgi:hypothetical protein